MMLCGECEKPYVQQPLGNWYRQCDCKTKRYWYDEPPSSLDARILNQLSGRTLTVRQDASGWRPRYRY